MSTEEIRQITTAIEELKKGQTDLQAATLKRLDQQDQTAAQTKRELKQEIAASHAELASGQSEISGQVAALTGKINGDPDDPKMPGLWPDFQRQREKKKRWEKWRDWFIKTVVSALIAGGAYAAFEHRMDSIDQKIDQAISERK